MRSTPGQLLTNEVILAQNSTVNPPLSRSGEESGIVVAPLDPSYPTPVPPAVAPAWPRVTPPEYEPVRPLPEASAAGLAALVSSSRQNPAGASASTWLR